MSLHDDTEWYDHVTAWLHYYEYRGPKLLGNVLKSLQAIQYYEVVNDGNYVDIL